MALGLAQDSLAARALAAVREEAATCSRCPLAATRQGHVVFGSGPVPAALMIVGEAPGKDEDREGSPFVGASGNTLNDLLSSAEILRADTYIANVVMSRPPGNRNPRAAEIAACAPYLEIQRQLVQPMVIIALGAVAASRLLGRRIEITKVRGNVYRLANADVVPTFHPRALKFSTLWREQSVRDFSKAASLLSRHRSREVL